MPLKNPKQPRGFHGQFGNVGRQDVDIDGSGSKPVRRRPEPTSGASAPVVKAERSASRPARSPMTRETRARAGMAVGASVGAVGAAMGPALGVSSPAIVIGAGALAVAGRWAGQRA